VLIDPIDGTNEFVKGVSGKELNGMFVDGVQITTILIGVFNRITSEPLMGVLNQPFTSFQNGTWRGTCYWGICYPNWHLSNIEKNDPQKEIVLLSRNDSTSVTFFQKKHRIEIITGAGNKGVAVIQGKAFGCLLSQTSIYKWDTCAPHAILKSLGGNMVNLANFNPLIYDLDIKVPHPQGILMYLSQDFLQLVKEFCKEY